MIKRLLSIDWFYRPHPSGPSKAAPATEPERCASGVRRMRGRADERDHGGMGDATAREPRPPDAGSAIVEQSSCVEADRVGKQAGKSPMRILVVEDDKKTAAFIAKALKAEGFAVDTLRDGDEALAAVETTAFDGIVMDIMILGRDGLSVLRQMRAKGNQTPVLLLSARGEVNERIEGLNAGAEDYLAKPFALAELVARVRALARRRGDTKSPVLQVGDLSLDTITRIADRAGRKIELTTREYRLLEFLMRSAGRVCSRMMILEKVWDWHFDPGTNLIDVYVGKLREKIDGGSEVKLFHTVRGEGYVMKEPE